MASKPTDKPIVNRKNDGVCRRALYDIGNVGNVQINRPVTRSFDTRSLANAQAVPAEQKKVMGGLKKKVTVKPNPEEVIEISPDTEEVVEKNAVDHLTKQFQKKVTVKAQPEAVIEITKEEKPKNLKKIARKEKTALSTVLMARSRAACGLTSKPNIADIDAGDANNVLALVEYVEDIYKFYKLAEKESQIDDYIHKQPEIDSRMRSILVDWLVEVHRKFQLMPETLYLTINIVDRFLSVRTVAKRELQLVGISAMLMACKYEEIWAPEVNDFVCISDRAYTNAQILVMEKIILGKLEWELTVPTPYHFLSRFIKAATPDQEMENMACFLAELGIMNYTTIMYCPSIVAASAVYAARFSLDKTPIWNETLRVHTGFSESELADCAKLLASYHSVAAESTTKLRSVYKKYSAPERGAVALLSPAKALLAST